MKNIYNKISGLLSLGLVVAIAASAILLSSPMVSAATTTTETIINEYVDYYAGSTTIDFDLATGTFTYVDKDGNTQTGNLTYYGYGDYTVTTSGVGIDGEKTAESSISFSYWPAYGDAKTKTVDGEDKDYLYVYYDPDEVERILVVITDENGNPVDFSPIEFYTNSSGITEIELPFANDGTYTISIYAYGPNSTEPLYSVPFTFTVNYENGHIVVPDTGDVGGLFGGLNISRADYLLTGAIAFGIIMVAGVFFLRQNKQRSAVVTRGVRTGRVARVASNKSNKSRIKSRRR